MGQEASCNQPIMAIVAIWKTLRIYRLEFLLYPWVIRDIWDIFGADITLN
jgi:hypothetical protein